MGRRLWVAWVVLAMLMACAGSVWAGEDQSEITRVALWKVDRADWAAYVKHVEKWQKPVMEKLVADGTVTEWGLLAYALHGKDGYTHATWFSTKNYADTAKVWAAYEAHGKKVGGSEDASAQALAKLEKGHMDLVFRDRHIQATPGSYEDAVLYEWTVTVNVDSGEDFEQFWKDEIQPVYEKLVADGAALAYGYSSQEIVTDNPGQRGSWVIFKDPSGMDKMEAAFAANRKGWSKTQGKLWWSGIKEMVEMGSFREFMGEVIHYGRAK